jgi:hypothetical protein
MAAVVRQPAVIANKFAAVPCFGLSLRVPGVRAHRLTERITRRTKLRRCDRRRSGYCSKRKPDKFGQGLDSYLHIPHSGEKNMMTKSTVVAAIVFSLAIGAGTAFAQNPPPAADHAAAGAMDKKAISKACSDQANAKNLHGKERKKFRAECKHKGGKME